MSVAVAGVRKAVEITWETGNAPAPEPPPEEKPPGFPAHPIFRPDLKPDHTLPGDLPHVDHELPQPEQPVDPEYGVEEGTKPDHTLPGDLPEVDHDLPGPQPKPEHPIFLPPYIDNSLPEPPPGTWGGSGEPFPGYGLPDPPPDLIGDIPPEKLEALKEFWLGNLPPYEGGPDYVAPVEAEAKHGTVLAVQVFAQGQDGDWSNTAVMPNDGRAVLTYPEGFSGESYVEVRDLFGALVDSGTIQVETN